jgi:hypothetical protein
MFRMLRLSLMIWVSLVATLVMIRVVSAAMPAPPSLASTLAADSQLAQGVWCWRDICPGATTMHNAQEQLRASAGAFIGATPITLRWQSPGNPRWHVELAADAAGQKVRTLYMFAERTRLTMGEMVLHFGLPQYVFRTHTPGSAVMWVCFEGNLCATLMHVTKGKLRYDSQIQQVTYEATFAFPDVSPWRGLATYPENQILMR